MLSTQYRKIIPLILALFLVAAFPVIAAGQAGNDLVLNYIEAQPVQGQMAFDVSATFSLLDGAGNPIKDLKVENVTLSEDGQAINPDSLDLVSDQPIYISLLLDTSGSMVGSKIEAARDAAGQFIAGLKENDRISVTTFNSSITSLINFSTEHLAAKNLVTAINAVQGSGTCLYDSVYEAVQKTTALPLGRRAVIVLTDGKDELPAGGACSKLTLDDVIDLASEGNTRVPVYTIGLGQNVDQQGLERLAKLTGGRYYKSPDASQLSSLFSQLQDALQSEYLLYYTSTNAPGNHTLALSVNYLNTTSTDTRGFILPSLPLNLTIVSPTTGQEITDHLKIATVISGQGQAIKQVVFSANEVVIGTDDTAPYELEWAPGSSNNGDVTITAAAIGTDNQELARGSVLAKIAVAESKDDKPTPFQGDGELSFFEQYKTYIIAGGGTALLLIAVAIFITFKKQRENSARDKQWHDMVVDPPEKSPGMSDMTMDGFVLSENSLGVLMVMQSDDPAMIGQHFEVTENSTRLGRAVDNDILFPKDGTVSRHHGILENRNTQLFLSEMVSQGADGKMKPPTFGTFVNENQVSQATPLRNGDLIRLGKRVVLKYEAPQISTDNDDAKTIDQLTGYDPEKTIDG